MRQRGLRALDRMERLVLRWKESLDQDRQHLPAATRVRDLFSEDGHRGNVIGIGIRSSVVKIWDGTETLIPNSALLENNLTNWTYSDRKVRFSVTIGVAYGSDTRRVAQLLAEVAERHGLVQKDPAPQVLFQEFGDNALTFELRY